jgi:hypothetical protein
MIFSLVGALARQEYSIKSIGPSRSLPTSVRPYEAKAWYLFIARRWDEALRAADAGLAINPSSASCTPSEVGSKPNSGASNKPNPVAQMAQTARVPFSAIRR